MGRLRALTEHEAGKRTRFPASFCLRPPWLERRVPGSANFVLNADQTFARMSSSFGTLDTSRTGTFRSSRRFVTASGPTLNTT
jgi:hypothetical protein